MDLDASDCTCGPAAIPTKPARAADRGFDAIEIWIVSGSGTVHTYRLGFPMPPSAQQAMARFQGGHDLVEDCTFEWSNSTGASFRAEDVTVRHVSSGTTASRVHRQPCPPPALRRMHCRAPNNVKNYLRLGSGGTKSCSPAAPILRIPASSRTTVPASGSTSATWTARVRNCLLADNEDAGIFYEIATACTPTTTWRSATALRKPRAWAANGGICLSSSPGCVISGT